MDKRFLVFWLVAVMIWLGWIQFMQVMNPPRKPIAKKQLEEPIPKLEDDAPAAAAAKPKQETAITADPNAKEAIAPQQVAKEPKLRESGLTLGKLHPIDDKTKPKYEIYAEFSNRHAAISHLVLNEYVDETRKHRLVLLQGEKDGKPAKEGPTSFELVHIGSRKTAKQTKDDEEPSTGFDTVNWEVVENSAERIVFRTSALEGKLQVEKRFSLSEQSPMIELEVAIKNLTDSPIEDLVYDLTGGNGLPIEGKWYARYHRKLVAAMRPTNGAAPYLEEQDAAGIAKVKDDNDFVVYSESPLQFAGIASQYFASLVVQAENAQESRTIGVVSPIDFDRDSKLKEGYFHNIGVKLTSVPENVGEGAEVVHKYLLFHGPKKKETLEQFPEYQLPLIIHFPNWLFLPIGTIARTMIAVLDFFHRLSGDHGVAIILLTLLVRGCMFPLSFKQTMSMQKMQALQPKMAEIKEKYANDKQKLQHEMMSLYGKHKVNPLGGCLPILIQFPIFIGLWQALQNSFDLRQSSFLYGLTWINDLAAPDQLMRFPFGKMPLTGWEYLNVLPILAVIQMILQAKYMSPPSSSPEMELQKKVMTYMMVGFGFLFYTVPAGLCVYIITSGAWSVTERKLLPKPKTPPGTPATSPSGANGSTATQHSAADEATWKTSIKSKKRKGKPRR